MPDLQEMTDMDLENINKMRKILLEKGMGTYPVGIRSLFLQPSVDSSHFFVFLERAELLRTTTFKFRRLVQKFREEMVKTWTRAVSLVMPLRVRLERADGGDKIWGKQEMKGIKNDYQASDQGGWAMIHQDREFRRSMILK